MQSLSLSLYFFLSFYSLALSICYISRFLSVSPSPPTPLQSFEASHFFTHVYPTPSLFLSLSITSPTHFSYLCFSFFLPTFSFVMLCLSISISLVCTSRFLIDPNAMPAFFKFPIFHTHLCKLSMQKQERARSLQRVCVGSSKNAILPAFRAINTLDPCTGSHRKFQKRNFTSILCQEHARSLHRVA